MEELGADVVISDRSKSSKMSSTRPKGVFCCWVLGGDCWVLGGNLGGDGFFEDKSSTPAAERAIASALSLPRAEGRRDSKDPRPAEVAIDWFDAVRCVASPTADAAETPRCAAVALEFALWLAAGLAVIWCLAEAEEAIELPGLAGEVRMTEPACGFDLAGSIADEF